MSQSTAITPREAIEARILLLRSQKVLLDSDSAALYGVELRTLLQAVKRNLERFPADFMFQLAAEEVASLRSRSVISSLRHGGRRYLPFAFTERGVAMLSSVLRGLRAVRMNIGIMRAFVRLRLMLASNAELACRLDELEKKYDQQFRVVFEAIRQLMAGPETEGSRREIGFHTLREAGATAPTAPRRRRKGPIRY